MGKTRKKAAQQYEILLSSDFYGAVDSWTEYLCLTRNLDGSITLTSRAREILAEAARYREKDDLPAIRRKEVWGFDGDYVVGQRLLPHDGGAAVTIPQNQFDVAAEWLMSRKWHWQPDFGEAWARIRAALYGPEFFSLAKPLPLLRSTARERLDRQPAGCFGKGDGVVPPQPNGYKPREIVIRCAGPSKPWIIWLEIVFIEWSRVSFSVYARTGEAVPGGGVSLGRLPRTAGQLSWRQVLKFVESHDLAAVSQTDPQPIEVYGVEPWQRDVIAGAMMRLS